tara:strand:+ start:33 stop:623 length:591 start_codon:yes stop_codon:yes gene_type:complete
MKNYTEEEKEMINGLLESYTEDCWISGGKHMSIRSEICLEHFQEANGLTPKPKLEVGKWYKDKNDGMIIKILKLGTTLTAYGFYSFGKWFDDMLVYELSMQQFLVEMNIEEVETALTKEVKKRGYTLDSEIVSFRGGTSKFYETGSTCFENGEFWWNGCIVMKDGVWATIVKTTTKMSVAQLEAAHGYTNLEITKD